MKFLITEQQLKTITEISDRIREQIDIIYQDKNLICFVPKTQESSKIYGSNANWCQRHKSGFDMWSERGLLIRFLFKGGRKIRTTYYFKKKRPFDDTYYWANENGWHVLTGQDENPFNAVNRKGRIRSTEKDIIDLIHTIPEECKTKVLEFIKKYEDGYDYCYRDEEYYTKKENVLKNNINIIKNKYQKYFDYINATENNFIEVFLNNDWEYTLSFGVYDIVDTINSKDFKEFNSMVFNKLRELLTYINEKRN